MNYKINYTIGGSNPNTKDKLKKALETSFK